MIGYKVFENDWTCKGFKFEDSDKIPMWNFNDFPDFVLEKEGE